MCGIVGFIDFRKQTGEPDLRRMSACLEHRGPDGEGVWVAEVPQANVALGHRRLSIIDLSTSANQPMHFDGLHLIFNGEIYNYREIREDLLGRGHQFRTHSDTEVILHAWREWGAEAIRQWHGMYAIALYDERSDELILIRDRAGVKPVFYSLHDDVFLFGSELKSFLPHPRFRKEINRDAVAAYLQFGYVPHPHCIYAGTRKLSPGHYLRMNLRSRKQDLVQYWNVYDAYNKPRLDLPLPEAIDETERILRKAFQYRMVADVPVGVFLSGGYDSTCVTALLQTDSTEKIKTFTIGMTDPKIDEAPFAREVARHLGTDHHEYYCSHAEALEIIPQLPFFYDEPFADSSAIPTILVSRMARKQVTVALSADAGDEVFAGYNRYDYAARFGSGLKKIPAPVRRIAASVMERISSDRIPYLRNRRNFHSRYDKVKNLLSDPSPAELMKNLTRVFTPAQLTHLMAVPFRELSTAHANAALLADADLLSHMMAVDYQTYMVDDILQKVDRATMSVSLEGREPFLDQDVIEWAAQLPSEYKYRQGQKKYPLRQIVHRYVPRELMERPKTGFGIPIESWLGKELRPLVEEHLSEAALGRHGLFQVAEVRKEVNAFFAGRTEKHLKIWYLLQFQMWYKAWME